MNWIRNELAQAIGRLDVDQPHPSRISGDQAAPEMERKPGVPETAANAAREAALAAEEQRYADFWGGQGADYDAMAEGHFAEHRGEADHDPYGQHWWDGERMASDRERSPQLVTELEAEDMEPEAG